MTTTTKKTKTKTKTAVKASPPAAKAKTPATKKRATPVAKKATRPVTKKRATPVTRKTTRPAASLKKIEKVKAPRTARIEVNPQLDLAHGIVEAISDKLGEKVIMLDLRLQTPFTDYFVICSANSERQIKAISDGISEYTLKHFKTKPRRIEGRADSGWMLLDFNGITVHIFSPTQRQFYQLEELWQDAPTVLKMQ